MVTGVVPAGDVVYVVEHAEGIIQAGVTAGVNLLVVLTAWAEVAGGNGALFLGSEAEVLLFDLLAGFRK